MKRLTNKNVCELAAQHGGQELAARLLQESSNRLYYLWLARQSRNNSRALLDASNLMANAKRRLIADAEGGAR